MAKEKLKRELGFRDLTFFYIVSGISLRWIATAAASGPSAVSVWLLAWCGFFLPLAGCVLELSSRYPAEGGLYVWTQEAFGEFAGFMAAWAYWMSNLAYFPSVLYFAASCLLFAAPRMQHLGESNAYYMLFAVGTLALVTVLHILGLGTGKWVNNLGAIGVALPIVLLIGMGLISFLRFGSATPFSLASMLPHTNIKNLVFWSTIFFAYGGCEAGSFMGEEIKDARRAIPRALLVGGVVITISYLAGTAAMLVALPSSSINGLGGFMSAIEFLSRKLGLSITVAPVAILVTISSVGAAGAYLSSTARLPFVAGIHHYLPPVFGRIHPRWKTPYIALISYGIAGILVGVLGQAGTSVKGAYDLLVSMSVLTYFIPYLFLFASMIRLRSRPAPPEAIRLPGGKPFAMFLATLGLLSTTATIVLSLFPTADETNPAAALAKIIGMTLVLLACGVAVYSSGRRSISRLALATKNQS
jgi:glutamate:GABA antiporter